MTGSTRKTGPVLRGRPFAFWRRGLLDRFRKRQGAHRPGANSGTCAPRRNCRGCTWVPLSGAAPGPMSASPPYGRAPSVVLRVGAAGIYRTGMNRRGPIYPCRVPTSPGRIEAFMALSRVRTRWAAWAVQAARLGKSMAPSLTAGPGPREIIDRQRSQSWRFPVSRHDSRPPEHPGAGGHPAITSIFLALPLAKSPFLSPGGCPTSFAWRSVTNPGQAAGRPVARP